MVRQRVTLRLGFLFIYFDASNADQLLFRRLRADINGNALDSAVGQRGRRDILVHSEKVSRIELPLERGETRQLRPVCRPDSIRSFVAAQIIHVCALGEIGPEHIEKFARPGDVALRILRIGPGGGHDEIVRPRAMAEAVADSGTRSQALSPLCSNTITVRLDGTRIKQSTKTSIA